MSCVNDMTGFGGVYNVNILSSRTYGDFQILNIFRKSDGKRNRKMCRIRFVDTQYEKEVRYDNALSGQVKDDSLSDLFGCEGYSTSREYAVWRMMMQRCYDPSHKGYRNYGAKGVFVCDRWHIFRNFLEDIKKIEGYNEELFRKGKLDLDKDRKSKELKMYSLETCKFLSRSENLKGRRWAKK